MVELDNYLQEKKKFVDECLYNLWSEKKGSAEIYQVMEYATMAGGKRLRPVLSLTTAEMLGKPGEEFWEIACALELIHTYSLVHDDLPSMDNDDLRRGQPTCHVIFGEAMAILGGDALLTLAFELLSRYGKKEDSATAILIMEEISSAAGANGMIGGQVIDLNSEGKEITLSQLDLLHRLKTGALIRASVIAGALAAGATPTQKEHLSRFAWAAGLAFQITDDLLNITGDPVEMGKNVNTDVTREKASYPLIEGEEEAIQRRDQLYLEALEELKPFGSNAEALKLLTYRLIYRQK